jgi:hypothetical protein
VSSPTAPGVSSDSSAPGEAPGPVIAESGPIVAKQPTSPASQRGRQSRRYLIVSTVLGLLVLAGGLTTTYLLGLKSRSGDAQVKPDTVPPTDPFRRPVLVTVQNMIATGATGLIEDSTPAYLSTDPVPFCADHACKVPGSEMWSGASLAVTCHRQGALMTNANESSPEVRRNPQRARSSLWYLGMMPNGRTGYLAEVYVTPDSRGGLGLPECPGAPDAPPS